MCGYCNVWMCVCVGMCMYGFFNLWLCVCGFCDVWVCVYVRVL